jgi:GTP-binding protein Era
LVVVIVELNDSDREDLVHVRARIWVETDSQKGILIGKAGKMIKTVGTAAREALELELGRRVHLDLRVDVRRRWRADERALDRLGLE